MLHYLLWRVLTGRHQKITLSFLLAGHTKFAPDWRFGLVKRQYRRSVVNCLEDICEVVNRSAPSVNLSQLCASQAGDIKYHHFHFPAGSTTVSVQHFCDSPLIEFDLSQHQGPRMFSDLPPEAQSSGLTLDRQWYLSMRSGSLLRKVIRT